MSSFRNLSHSLFFREKKEKKKRRIELSRFSLLFSLFHDMIFLVLWLFAVDSSQKMSYVPSPLFIYICDVHFSSIWPTHRYVIISSCSFLSVLHHQHQPKSILAFVCVITSSNVAVIISLTASKLSPFWKVDKWENFNFFFFLIILVFLSTRRRYMSHTEPNEMRVRRSKQPPAGEETRAVCREPSVCGIRFDIQDSDERKEE